MSIYNNWPKHYKPLPKGYSVCWLDGHFFGMGPNDIESDIHWSRFAIRRWCFDHERIQHEKKSI